MKLRITINALIVCLTITCLACATSPTGRHELNLVSDAQMKELGAQAWTQVCAKYPRSTNTADIKFVDQIAARVIAASPLAKEKWDVELFESKDANAFALPGGHIGVFSGILPIAQDAAGLATVLAHETGHVIANHSRERASNELAAQGVLTVASGVLGSSQFHDPLMAALGLGTQVGILLPYSRAQESEADQIGLDLMARAGYDPRQALGFWDRMVAASHGEPPGFLSDHPPSSERIAALKKLMPAAEEVYAKAPVKLGGGGRIPAGNDRAGPQR